MTQKERIFHNLLTIGDFFQQSNDHHQFLIKSKINKLSRFKWRIEKDPEQKRVLENFHFDINRYFYVLKVD